MYHMLLARCYLLAFLIFSINIGKSVAKIEVSVNADATHCAVSLGTFLYSVCACI